MASKSVRKARTVREKRIRFDSCNRESAAKDVLVSVLSNTGVFYMIFRLLGLRGKGYRFCLPYHCQQVPLYTDPDCRVSCCMATVLGNT